MNTELFQLYNVTLRAVRNARELARSQRQDEARGWLRYFNNARILELLNFYRPAGFFTIDLPKLQSELSALNDEVYPSTSPDNRTDLQRIRLCLEQLCERLAEPVPAHQSARAPEQSEPSSAILQARGKNSKFPVATVCSCRIPKQHTRTLRGPSRGPTNKTGSEKAKRKMTLKLNVIADRPNEYTGKKGLVKNQLLVLQDAEPGVNRCQTQLEYEMSPDEKDKYAGKLQDKVIQLGVRELFPFGGRIRVRAGQILSVEGLK